MTNNLATITINIKQQALMLYRGDELVKSYTVCTAKNGVGEQFGSECTPRGQHIVRAKIGENTAINSVFVGRRFSGEIFEPALMDESPDRDWILTRILWLSGLEVGKNRLGNVDTMRRYIYIHGAPDSLMSAQPSSHGCIRMLNADVIDLFERIPVGTLVSINE
ncbi:MAG: L,D-transpeptidase [Cycloclasticus sp.]